MFPQEEDPWSQRNLRAVGRGSQRGVCVCFGSTSRVHCFRKKDPFYSLDASFPSSQRFGRKYLLKLSLGRLVYSVIPSLSVTESLLTFH